MALLFMDSFDHEAASSGNVNTVMLLKWTNSSQTDSTTPAGRTNKCLLFTNRRAYLYKDLSSHQTYIAGFAFRWNNGGTYRVCSLEDSASGNNLATQISGSGVLTALGPFGTSATLATFSSGDWHYIEMKVVVGNTGSWEVKVDSVSVGSDSSVDTQVGSNAYCDRIVIGPNSGSSASMDYSYDDLYVCDGSGSAPTNDFLGDCKVENIMPSGNGNSSQFDGSDGNTTDNYVLVDEVGPTGDTDYVESGDVGDKDTYAFGNLATTVGTVYGVQIAPYMRKTDAGLRGIKTVARLSATETDSAEHNLINTYRWYTDIRETKPGGGAWSISDVNSAEFGQKVST